MGGTGLEPENIKPAKSSTCENQKNSTVQNPVQSNAISTDLLKLAQALSALPDDLKQQIIKLAGQSAPDNQPHS